MMSNTMKKLLALILAAVLLSVLLCGCGKDNAANQPTEPAETATPEATEAPAPEETPVPEQEADSVEDGYSDGTKDRYYGEAYYEDDESWEDSAEGDASDAEEEQARAEYDARYNQLMAEMEEERRQAYEDERASIAAKIGAYWSENSQQARHEAEIEKMASSLTEGFDAVIEADPGLRDAAALSASQYGSGPMSSYLLGRGADIALGNSELGRDMRELGATVLSTLLTASWNKSNAPYDALVPEAQGNYMVFRSYGSISQILEQAEIDSGASAALDAIEATCNSLGNRISTLSNELWYQRSNYPIDDENYIEKDRTLSRLIGQAEAWQQAEREARELSAASQIDTLKLLGLYPEDVNLADEEFSRAVIHPYHPYGDETEAELLKRAQENEEEYQSEIASMRKSAENDHISNTAMLLAAYCNIDDIRLELRKRFPDYYDNPPTDAQMLDSFNVTLEEMQRWQAEQQLSDVDLLYCYSSNHSPSQIKLNKVLSIVESAHPDVLRKQIYFLCDKDNNVSGAFFSPEEGIGLIRFNGEQCSLFKDSPSYIGSNRLVYGEHIITDKRANVLYRNHLVSENNGVGSVYYHSITPSGNVLRETKASGFEYGDYTILEVVKPDGEAVKLLEGRNVSLVNDNMEYSAPVPITYRALTDDTQLSAVIDVNNARLLTEDDEPDTASQAAAEGPLVNAQRLNEQYRFLNNVIYDSNGDAVQTPDLSLSRGVNSIYYVDNTYWIMSNAGWFYALDDSFKQIQDPVSFGENTKYMFTDYGLLVENYDEGTRSHSLRQYDSRVNLVREYAGVQLSDVSNSICGNERQGWYDLRTHELLRITIPENGFQFLSWQE